MNKIFALSVFTMLLLIGCQIKESITSSTKTSNTELNELSTQFLKNLKDGKPTTDIQQELADWDMVDLKQALQTDAHKYAFWINIYNAYIQVILKDQPALYDDRRNFFSKKQIKIAGENFSFVIIEHGILRKSQWPLGVGYITKWFPGKLERQLRVKKRDYHIHFALNCGAKDCPPVPFCNPENLNYQFATIAKQYLQKTSIYSQSDETLKVTALFSWFRGDFGGKKGIRKILEKYDVVPNGENFDVAFKDYDWSLYLDNYIES